MAVVASTVRRKTPEIKIVVSGTHSSGRTLVTDEIYLALQKAGFTNLEVRCKNKDSAADLGKLRDLTNQLALQHKIIIIDADQDHTNETR